MTQRERFEAWLSGSEWHGLTLKRRGDEYTDVSTQLAFEAWQAACPEGWQAVPVDPTAGMMKALWLDDPFARHSAMLAAAPKPEDVCSNRKRNGE